MRLLAVSGEPKVSIFSNFWKQTNSCRLLRNFQFRYFLATKNLWQFLAFQSCQFWQLCNCSQLWSSKNCHFLQLFKFSWLPYLANQIQQSINSLLFIKEGVHLLPELLALSITLWLFKVKQKLSLFAILGLLRNYQIWQSWVLEKLRKVATSGCSKVVSSHIVAKIGNFWMPKLAIFE